MHWARSYLHSAGSRPSHASVTVRSSCPHLRGNSSSLGTIMTIPNQNHKYLSWHHFHYRGAYKSWCEVIYVRFDVRMIFNIHLVHINMFNNVRFTFSAHQYVGTSIMPKYYFQGSCWSSFTCQRCQYATVLWHLPVAYWHLPVLLHSFEVYSSIDSSTMTGDSPIVSNFNWLFLKLNQFIRK